MRGVIMGYEVKMMEEPVFPAAAGARAGGAGLPPGAVMADRAAGWLRAYLCRRGLEEYQVFCSNDLDLHDLDEHLESLGGAGGAAEWEPVDSLVPGGAQPSYLPTRRKSPPAPSGVVRLRGFDAVVARCELTRELAERAEIQLRTSSLDGKQMPLTWYFHTIPIAPHLKSVEEKKN